MSSENTKRGLSTMNELSEARLWKTLDSIDVRLNNIEIQLKEVVRLEERVNSHEHALARYGNRLDSHDLRLREAELWQANHGDKAYFENSILNIKNDINKISDRVGVIENNSSLNKGQKDIGKEILKWIAGILATIIIFNWTKG